MCAIDGLEQGHLRAPPAAKVACGTHAHAWTHAASWAPTKHGALHAAAHRCMGIDRSCTRALTTPAHTFTCTCTFPCMHLWSVVIGQAVVLRLRASTCKGCARRMEHALPSRFLAHGNGRAARRRTHPQALICLPYFLMQGCKGASKAVPLPACMHASGHATKAALLIHLWGHRAHGLWIISCGSSGRGACRKPCLDSSWSRSHGSGAGSHQASDAHVCMHACMRAEAWRRGVHGPHTEEGLPYTAQPPCASRCALLVRDKSSRDPFLFHDSIWEFGLVV